MQRSPVVSTLCLIRIFAACLLATAIGASLGAQAPNDDADAARLMDLLTLNRRSVVADIGAGSGPLTIRIAARVRRVFSTDLNPTRRDEIKAAATKAGLRNITVLEGAPSATALPRACCDAIFMRDVYHHFADPLAMNRSILASLKRGGALVVIDFAPDSGRTAAPGLRDRGRDHGIMEADLIDELRATGFANVRAVPWPSEGYFAVEGERPK